MLIAWFNIFLFTALVPQSEAASQPVPWKSDSALVFLHRSAGLVAPENTVPAFEAAVRQGADGIETDIRKTRDGEFVIYHDDWVLRQRGPTGKIEEMTLEETLRLDVGERFGPQWRGIRLPFFGDLLRFAKANDLLLYLDIKTPGIYEEVMQVVKLAGCLRLVYATGGQVPQGNYHLPIPWIAGWNYSDGGEEDPDRMREAIAKAPKGVYGIMCDDARSIVRALGRHPEKRSLVPFVSTMSSRLKSHKSRESDTCPSFTAHDLAAPDLRTRRGACLFFAQKPDSTVLSGLCTLAEHDPDFIVRQEACWALGSLRDARAADVLFHIAQTPYNQKTAASTGYRDFFLKTAAGCALARLNADAGRAALNKLIESSSEGDRSAAAIGLAVFGTEKDIPTLVSLVEPVDESDRLAADFVVGYAGRFGAKAIPIYVAGLSRGDIAKAAVFRLAAIGKKALPAIRKVQEDQSAPLKVRRRALLAERWMNDEPVRDPLNTLAK